MIRRDIIDAIFSIAKNAPTIFTTGYTSREAFEIKNKSSNFYMLGSMGLAASIGIGVALNKQETPVIVVEGDGSFLMAPNNMYIAGNLKIANFIHIIIDNNMYESTGRQKTITKNLDLAKAALLAGYRLSQTISTLDDFKRYFLESVSTNCGPYFFHVIVNERRVEVSKRVHVPLEDIRKDFSGFLNVLSKENLDRQDAKN